MKWILILLLLTGCVKEKQPCYKCELSNGTVKNVCGQIPVFKDSQGNSLSSFCREQ